MSRKRGGFTSKFLLRADLWIVIMFPISCGVIPASWSFIVSAAASKMYFQYFGVKKPIYCRKSAVDSCLVDGALDGGLLHGSMLGRSSGFWLVCVISRISLSLRILRKSSSILWRLIKCSAGSLAIVLLCWSGMMTLAGSGLIFSSRLTTNHKMWWDAEVEVVRA